MVAREGEGVSSLPLYPPGAKAQHRLHGWAGEIGYGSGDEVAVIWKSESDGHWAAGLYEPSEIDVQVSQIFLPIL